MAQPNEAELPLTGEIVNTTAPKRQTRAVKVQEPEAPAPVAINEAAAVLSMIERVARDPSVDIDRLERLLDMQERIVTRNAKNAYLEALSAMQPELPVIDENGEIRHKSDGPVISTYALWEDVNEHIKPVLTKHGFSLTFKVERQEGLVCVTAILGHRAGHSEETTLPLPVDASGAKNAVQAIGSSTSYGQRYTAKLLLNLTSRNNADDDDGKKAVNNKSSSKAKEDGDWDKIEAEFSECDDLGRLTWRKDQWKAKVPKGWLRDLQDKFAEHQQRIRQAGFEPRQ